MGLNTNMWPFSNSNKQHDEQSAILAREMSKTSLDYNLLTLRNTLSPEFGNTYQTIDTIFCLKSTIISAMDMLGLKQVKLNEHEILCPWYLVRTNNGLRLAKQPNN